MQKYMITEQQLQTVAACLAELPYKQVSTPMAIIHQVTKQTIVIEEPEKAVEPDKSETPAKKDGKADSKEGVKDPK
jgi:hypothetical protein